MRGFVVFFLVISCWQLSLLSAVLAEETSPSPNIVLILSDDQAWTDYSFMGHPVIETPQLDRLAGRSAVFRRGYTPASKRSVSISAARR